MQTTTQQIDIFNKFTNHLRKALLAAQNLAAALGCKEIKPLHLLYGLAAQRGSLAADVLNKTKLTVDKIQHHAILLEAPDLLEQAEKKLPITSFTGNILELPSLGQEARYAIEKAVVIAVEHKHRYIGTEHLLYSLLERLDHDMESIITQEEADVRLLTNQLSMALKSASRFPELNDEPGVENQPAESDTPALDALTTDLTNPEFQKSVDPLIGREAELERLVNILARRHKNNPILLGDPGVGKTAIVEGLAKRIIEGKVPPSLLKKRILNLDVGLLVAGTMFRGEFEQRLKQMLEEVKTHPEIILFIDEIHTIIGTGASGGSLDMANMLKPALARGEIRCIGATTMEEYKKTIESDGALDRRFQSITVGEPTVEETIQILQGVKRNYEQYHRVEISDHAIIAAAELSNRYLTDRFLPDKAIDLLDEAAASLKVKAGLSKEEKIIDKLEEELKKAIKEKQQAGMQEKYDEAFKHKERESEIRQQLAAVKEQVANQRQTPVGVITAEHIAVIISRQTKIPVESLVREEKQALLDLEQQLAKSIVGQEEAIKKISETIRLSRLGITDRDRPLGSFLFLGPSGVGKTELAKQLVSLVFKDPKALVRIDMSEFGESFTASKLIGSPAGYVGYKEGGMLTERVKRQPYSVVLLDEIEKAHPDIFNLFLQMLDEGKLTDAAGEAVSYRNCVVIFTSNIGLESFNEQASLGFRSEGTEETDLEQKFTDAKNKILKELKNHFRVEFINRLDQIVVFKPLQKKDLKEIVKLRVKDLEERLGQYRLKLLLSDKATDRIVEQSFSPEQGARSIRKYIKDNLENQIAQLLLKGAIKEGTKVKIGVKDKELVIS
ncbi:MAG: ATP-dependent Clp protease ATP-binding subunit [bacterium]